MSNNGDNNGQGGENSGGLTETSLAFIGASVTLVLAIIIIILLIISFRLCLKVVQRRYMVQQHLQNANSANQENSQNNEEDPNLPSFNWRHSLRIAGTLPPSYEEAKELPSLDDVIPIKTSGDEIKLNTEIIKGDKTEVCIDIGEESTGYVDGTNTDEQNGPTTPNTDTVIVVQQDDALMDTLTPTDS
ncbi:uncharacterized protein [Dysidea avara]|uniref:uncharacterized protein n=1 Tax=Dysidea avara TaxID=196820 RepID=UPI003321902D